MLRRVTLAYYTDGPFGPNLIVDDLNLINMDRKNFFKTACGAGIGSCVGFGLLSKGELFAAANQDIVLAKNTPVVPVNARQVQNVLSYIDSSMDESIKERVFGKLGYEHTTSESFKKWINGYKSDVKSFFNMVNSNKDTYWEKIEYNPETSAIKVTGKPADRCACPYAQNENPPKSLCNYCCKNFQKQMFEMLLDKKVTVRIDEAFLLGDKRCSTTIFVEGKLKMG
jgi:hypothetical protein